MLVNTMSKLTAQTALTPQGLRRQRRADGVQIRKLMSVAEAARVTMGIADEMPLVPRLLIEDQSQIQTAEDAWRATDTQDFVVHKPAKAASVASGGWLPWGVAQLIGSRATA